MHASEYGIVAVLVGVIVVLGKVIQSVIGNRLLKTGAKRNGGNGNGKRFSEAIRNAEDEKAEKKARTQMDEIHRALMQPGTNGAPFITNSINKGLETLDKIHEELRRR